MSIGACLLLAFIIAIFTGAAAAYVTEEAV